MRLDAITLRRFGIFDDLTLDLSQGEQGVHIVHGPNEAGKSTLLAGLRCALYGFDQRKHDFLDQRDPRVGGTVREGNRTLAFLRRRGRKGTLLNPDENALADDALASFLNGVPQAVFENLHGLSHHQLVAGGRDIVEAKGDVGSSLFAAAGGIQHVQRLARDLQTDCEAIFKPRASAPSLNAALREYEAAKQAERTAALSTAKFEEQRKALADAEQRARRLQEAWDDAERSILWLERCQRAYESLHQLHAVREELAGMEGIPLLREDFRQDRRDAVQARTRAEEAMARADAELASLHSQAQQLSVNKDYLEHDAAIQALETDAAIVRAALHDRATVVAPAAESARADVARCLQEIGASGAPDDARRLVPSAPVRAGVRALAESFGGLKADFDAKTQRLDETRRALADVQQKLARSEETADAQGVETALEAARRLLNDADALDTMEQEILTERAALEQSLQRMGRWQGTLEQVAVLALPDETTIQQFRDAFSECDRQEREYRDDRQRLEVEFAQTEDTLRRLAAGETIPSEAELDRLRARRDADWHALRDAWIAGASAQDLPRLTRDAILDEAVQDGFQGDDALDAFGWNIARADEIADRLRREADRVAEYANTEASLARQTADLARLETIRDEHAKARAALDQEWAALWEPLRIPHGTPGEMLAWRRAWDTLVRGITDLAKAEAHERRIRTRVDEARASLLAAWRAVSTEPEDRATASLPGIVAAAGRWVAASHESRRERGNLEEQHTRLRDDDLPRAELELEAAKNEMTKWEKDWAARMKAIGLAKQATPAEASSMLNQLDALKDALDALDQAGTRIRQIDETHEAFRIEAERVFAAVGFDPAEERPEEAAARLNKERERAARDQAARDRLDKQVAGEEARRREAQQALEAAAQSLERLCTEAGADSEEELPALEERADRRRQLEARRANLEAAIAREAHEDNPAAFESKVRDEEFDTLEARLTRARNEKERLRTEDAAAREELGRLRAAFDAMDGAAAAAAYAQDAAAAHARVSALAEDFARIALAQALLQGAVRRYQQQHEGPMIAAASRFFGKLTIERFRELRAVYDPSGTPVLVGVRPDGMEVSVDGMSDGTADQLFLALRLAALERNGRQGPTMPLILDDVLINFDDDRAAAAFHAFAELSAQTQVILFTHHAHLLEVARSTLESGVVFTHSLPGTTA